jgi:hypothetical protein
MTKSSPAGPSSRPAILHTLLDLNGRERHGYDIMQQVKICDLEGGKRAARGCGG